MLFATPGLGAADQAALDAIAHLHHRLRHAVNEPRRWQGLLRRGTLARAIQGSNSIEGYVVSLDDAAAAVEGEEPLDADERAWREVTGYRDAMTYVLQLAGDPHVVVDATLLRSLHFMMLGHDLSKSPGRWRPGDIHVRREDTGEVVYTGPDAADVPPLVDALVASLRDDAEHVLVRAAMAHLNLAMIHPFRDGNGRMARCLQTLVLAHGGVLAAPFCSIEEHLGRHTPEYYEVLALVGGGSWQPHRNALPWVRFVLEAHWFQARTLLRRDEELGRLWDGVFDLVVEREVPPRAMSALVDAARGYRVRNAAYRLDAEVTMETAARDLGRLVRAGLLVPYGEKRGRHYVASDELRQLHREIVADRRPLTYPYAAWRSSP